MTVAQRFRAVMRGEPCDIRLDEALEYAIEHGEVRL